VIEIKNKTLAASGIILAIELVGLGIVALDYFTFPRGRTKRCYPNLHAP